MREVTPTRSTALDLADELRLMRQGYEFLDEKRMLLATEMLRQMRQHQAQSEVFEVEIEVSGGGARGSRRATWARPSASLSGLAQALGGSATQAIGVSGGAAVGRLMAGRAAR